MKSEMPIYNHSISPSLNLINTLIHLKEHGPWVTGHGICINIYTFFDQIEWAERKQVVISLDLACKKWPKAQKFCDLWISDFPVGGAEEYAEEQRLGTLWQNAKRLELLDFIIDHLNTEGFSN